MYARWGRDWALPLTDAVLNPSSTTYEMGDPGKLFSYSELSFPHV